MVLFFPRSEKQLSCVLESLTSYFCLNVFSGNSPVLHLMDEKFDLVSVRTSGSLEHLAIEELVKPYALVALSNLQLRQLPGPVPCLYASENALFSINPKESHLQETMVHLKSFVQVSVAPAFVFLTLLLSFYKIKCNCFFLDM